MAGGSASRLPGLFNASPGLGSGARGRQLQRVRLPGPLSLPGREGASLAPTPGEGKAEHYPAAGLRQSAPAPLPGSWFGGAGPLEVSLAGKREAVGLFGAAEGVLRNLRGEPGAAPGRRIQQIPQQPPERGWR